MRVEPLTPHLFFANIVPLHDAAPQLQGNRFLAAGVWRSGRT